MLKCVITVQSIRLCVCVCVHTKASDEFLSGQWSRDVFAGSILGFATA